RKLSSIALAMGSGIAFCLTLAACLSISDSKAQFGYIYCLSTIIVLAMYCLIWLMCHAVELE
ncbi:hypothetical protein, partial [Citrobacter youngae]|uniref:hypothetical protein n=1 Tax=Citrobacter youngae TaxID=133448 RepID=UPI001953C76C